MKKIILLIIGSEILQGKTRDANIFNLAQFLHLKPFHLKQVVVVSDELEIICSAIKNAWEEADIVITSGGMGPTPDDLTKTALSKWSNKELEFNQDAFKIAISHYERFQRSYHEKQIFYHFIPQNFRALYNPTGMAPGLAFTENQKWIFALPGVPSEFNSMFKESVYPLIEQKSETIEDYFIAKTWQLPESQIFNQDWPSLWDELKTYGAVSSLPHPLGVDIGVALKGTVEKIASMKNELLAKFKNGPIKNNIWHFGKDSLEEVIFKYAKDSKKTFGFVESCTGGLCSSKMTDVSGISSFFKGSLITYQNSCKEKILGIDSKLIAEKSAVSIEVAQLMAQNGRSILGADVVISLTGMAGPLADDKNPVGRLYCGIASENRNEVMTFNFKGDRAALKERFAQAGLHLLRETLK